jgi:hypothetical protein
MAASVTPWSAVPGGWPTASWSTIASAVVDGRPLLPVGDRTCLADGSLSSDLLFARWVPCPFARSTIRGQEACAKVE